MKKNTKTIPHIDSFRHWSQEVLPSYAEKVCFRFFGKNGELETLSYRELSEAITKTAAGFHSLGLDGKRIGVVGESCPEWIISFCAAILVGGSAIPLDKELDLSELCGFLDFASADALVFAKSYNKKYKEISEKASSVKYYIPINFEDFEYKNDENVLDFSELLTRGSVELENGFYLTDNTDENHPACMLFTSGTTGTSKCVMLSESNLCSCVNSACSSVDFCAEDIIVSVLPLHHTYELACNIAALAYGIEICINDSLKHVIKNFKLFRPTGLVLVPLFVNTMHKKIWDEAKKKGKSETMKAAIKISNAARHVGIDLRRKIFDEVLSAFGGRLKKIVCGGAPMNPEMTANFDAFGVTLVEGYGITECSPLISVNPYKNRKSGSVGPAVDCCEVKIDGDSVGESGFITGEILVKGKNVMLGYYKNPEATSAVFTEDGYFRTGDVGYLDNDGYIFITGRLKNVIVLNNGKNVFPEEIEEYLADIENIAEAVVVGRQSEGSDEVVLTAIVFPNFDLLKTDDLTEVASIIKQDIMQLNKKLPSFKQIRNIEIRKTEFEKTTTRKIKRYKVQ